MHPPRTYESGGVYETVQNRAPRIKNTTATAFRPLPPLWAPGSPYLATAALVGHLGLANAEHLGPGPPLLASGGRGPLEPRGLSRFRGAMLCPLRVPPPRARLLW
mgnify:CR=1 FL=1